MKREELFDICVKFRYAIEKVKKENGFFSTIPTKDRMSCFPKECCDDTSDLLGYYLKSNYNIDTKQLVKVYKSDDNLECLHCVLILPDGIVIDLTGDQFDDKRESVYVGKEDDWLKNMKFKSEDNNYDFFSENYVRLIHDYKAIIKKMK